MADFDLEPRFEFRSRQNNVHAKIIFVKMTMAVYKAQNKKLQNQRLGVLISTVKTAVKMTETEFRSRQNKTKQTPLFPVTFQKPFSTFEEHFETIIMQIKEL